MKILTKLAKMILIILLTICIVAISIVSIVSSTILDKNYVLQKLEETNFYSETYKLLMSNFENYIYPSGLDVSVLDNICTQEKVKEDVNTIISNLYDGTNIQIDTTEISNNLIENINSLDIKGRKNEQAIKQFSDIICTEYKDTIIHTKYEDNINKIYFKLKDILNKVSRITIIVMMVTLFVIILINIKSIYNAIVDIGVSMLSGGILLFFTYNMINSRITISGIKIFNDVFSNSLVTILQDVMKRIMTYSIWIIIIALVAIVVYSIIKSIKNEEE